MTWNLVATGAAKSEEAEQALVADLKEVLSRHDAGTAASGFNGETHRGTVHDAEPEPEYETVPAGDEGSQDEAPAE